MDPREYAAGQGWTGGQWGAQWDGPPRDLEAERWERERLRRRRQIRDRVRELLFLASAAHAGTETEEEYQEMLDRAVSRALREYGHPGWDSLIQEVEGSER